MRSTPFFIGDRLYHIRYDLNAVWDMECIIPGGFYSILDRPITFEFIADLLWFGMKWDNPDLTSTDTRKILKGILQENRSLRHRFMNWISGSRDEPILMGILTACKNEMFVSGWYSDPKMEAPAKTFVAVQDSGEPVPVTGIDAITHLEKAAYYYQYPGDVWKLTPNEIMYYVESASKRQQEEAERSDFHMANVCAAVYNSVRKQGTDRFYTWQDMMPKFADTAKKQSAEDMHNMIQQINAMFGGEVGA